MNREARDEQQEVCRVCKCVDRRAMPASLGGSRCSQDSASKGEKKVKGNVDEKDERKEAALAGG